MLPPVFQTLKASADVRAIVGSNPPRIYRHGEALQRAQTQPQEAYITWSLVSGVPENNLSESHPVNRQSVQVDCWHPENAGIETLADAVRDAIEPVAHMTAAVVNNRDPDTRLYRIGLQFDFWGR